MKKLLIFILIITVVSVVLPGCSKPSTTGLKGIQSKFFYTKNSDGSPGYTIIFSLSNYTSKPITAVKAEVVDGAGGIKRTIDESAISKTSSGGIIEMDRTLSLSHKTSDVPKDIKQWTVRWQYLDGDGTLSNISGNYFDRK